MNEPFSPDEELMKDRRYGTFLERGTIVDGKCDDCEKEETTIPYLKTYHTEEGAPQWKQLNLCEFCYFIWRMSPRAAMERRESHGLPSL